MVVKMKLSEHFDTDVDARFKCRCCGKFIHVPRLITELEIIRAIWGNPITIISGTRCEAYNRKVGGATHSRHLTGEAADIVVSGIDPYTVYHTLCELYPDSKGIGQYHTFTHFDIRDEKARWGA